jgi:hypothetical protein
MRKRRALSSADKEAVGSSMAIRRARGSGARPIETSQRSATVKAATAIVSTIASGAV